MELPVMNFFSLFLQGGFELPRFEFPYLGTRGITGITMLTHIFFATLFVGYAVGSPLLQYWSVRTGNPRMERLAHSMARFNVLTFSVGATFAVMFLVLLVGFYPRVTMALFTHFFWFFPILAMTAMLLTLWLFYVHYYRAQNRARPLNIVAGIAAAVFILLWQTILTGIDTFMVTGGGGTDPATQGGAGGFGTAFYDLLTPTFVWQNLHRIFGNLSWPAFAIAAWAAFSYRTAKSAEDKAFYDWAGSMGVIWGTGFLLLQPFAGFAIAYATKLGSPGPYERLTGSGSEGDTFTSNLLYINLAMVVGLFVLSNVAMYMGAQRHPDLAGQRPIRFFGLVAALAGLYSISPLAKFPYESPFFWLRYIAILLMVLATVGALISYARGRMRFTYGNPGGGYLTVLLLLGALAAVVTLSMGWMKSNSRAPYTIYGQPQYTVNSETPVTQDQLNQETPRVLGTPKSEATPRAKEG